MKKASRRRTVRRVPVSMDAANAEVAARRRYSDLDGFFGSWVADPEVDRALAEQRRVFAKLHV